MSTKFQAGEAIVVVDYPYEAEDRRFSGKAGVVKAHTSTNSVDDVYSVSLEGEQYDTLLYGMDLELQPLSLEQRKAKLKEELEEVEKLIENSKQEDVISRFPIGSSIRFTDNVVIKVGENKWHWIYIGTADEFQHHSNSDDKAIVKEQREYRTLGRVFTIHRADRD